MKQLNSYELDNKLKASTKLVFRTILSMSDEVGVCMICNDEIVTQASVSDRTVTNAIKELVENGYIVAEYRYINDNGTPKQCRVITVQNLDFVTQMNNQSSLTETAVSEAKNDSTDDAREIIDYLNEVTGSKYSYKTEATNKLIKARIKDGYSVDDFKTVIDNKFDEWGSDEKMSKYLRPETLFGNKFESYLNSNTKTVEKKEWEPIIWTKNGYAVFEPRNWFNEKQAIEDSKYYDYLCNFKYNIPSEDRVHITPKFCLQSINDPSRPYGDDVYDRQANILYKAPIFEDEYNALPEEIKKMFTLVNGSFLHKNVNDLLTRDNLI